MQPRSCRESSYSKTSTNTDGVNWQFLFAGQKADGAAKPSPLLFLLFAFGIGMFVGIIAGMNGHAYIYQQTTNFHVAEDSTSCLPMVRRDPLGFLQRASPPFNVPLQHTMTDNELFCRALAMPPARNVPFKRVPKIAFMFLTKSSLPLSPLWEKFFSGHEGLYSIYVHTVDPLFSDYYNSSSVFSGRRIPSQNVVWGSINMVDAERRLVANALLDVSNERFVLLSDTCIPLHNFTTVYGYLISSDHSHVEMYDIPGHRSRGRYNKLMEPEITLSQWRKGSQWFELQRELALSFIADNKYYSVFKRFCKPTCYPDEHYLPTLLNIYESGSLNANTSLTWVDWSRGAPHPREFSHDFITEKLIRRIRTNCTAGPQRTSTCFLFARKFQPSSLEPLLALSSQIMEY